MTIIQNNELSNVVSCVARTDYHVTTLIVYRFIAIAIAISLLHLQLDPHLNLNNFSLNLSFDNMPRTSVTAKMCTGGTAKRVSLAVPIHAPDVQMQQPMPPLDLQVSAHHLIEHP